MYPRNQAILSVYILRFFPTCQVRVVRCYVSCPTSLLVLLLLLGHLNCKLVIAVVPAGPQLQALDRSAPRLNHKDHEESSKIYQIQCQKECQKICQVHMPERMSERISEHMPEGMPE